MKQSNRLLKILVTTAIGILLFSGAVFAILNLTDSDSNKKSSTSTSQKSEEKSKKEKSSVKEDKKENKSDNKKEESLETTESVKNDSSNNNSEVNKNDNNSVKNTPITNNANTEKNLEEKVVETTKAEEKINTKIEDNPNYTNGRVYEYNGKKLSPTAGTGNTGQVFATQAEASAYGQAEIEKRVKETKKPTSYSVGRVLYEDGSQAGWTVDIYNGQ